ncbi:Hint domain-containing protein [Acetobacter sp. UBA5411]|uniref:Hint domain-containing protein n=1 Tax=Acetobacter sp. UBA5411 TaxID=1945905 RepID=UPI0025B920A9|nr:Hint domain-containing protein [Acetobacter sp. UBA5411]
MSDEVSLDVNQTYTNDDDLVTKKTTVTATLDEISFLTIANSGTLESTTKRGIDTSGDAAADTVLVIQNSGTISGSDDGIRVDSDLPDGALALINTGTIESTTDGQAVDFNSVATNDITLIFNVGDGEIISTDADALRPGNNAIIFNTGTIDAGGVNGATKNDGIDFQDYGGVVLNNGTITGARHAITSSENAIVINGVAGTILGRDGSGVGSDGDGTVFNYGTITGAYDGSGTGDGDGVDIDGYATITNYGTIEGTGASGNGSDGLPNGSEGVSIGGGDILNAANAVISGANNGILVDNSSEGNAPYATTIVNAGTIQGLDGYGIHITDTFGDTITNAGYISGTTYAILLGSGDDTLNILTGSEIDGTVDGGAGSNTVNLVGTGTFNGADNFQTMTVSGNWVLTGDQSYSLVALNTDATLTLEGAAFSTQTIAFSSSGTLILDAADSFSAAVVNMSASDYIDFSALTYSADATVQASGNTVTVTSGSTTYTLTVSLADTVNQFALAADEDGSLLLTAVVCFLPGSLVETETGAVAVENLQPGMMVPTYDSGHALLKEIIWVGRQDVRVQADLPPDMAGCPVRIRAGALADNVPFTDLLVTPEHCLWFDGRFVPVRMLVNGRSIAYDRTIRSYTCYHIETQDHAVIRVNGLLTESYLDTGNRRNFRPVTDEHVVAAFSGKSKSWEEDAAGQLCVDRAFVEPLFNTFAERAVATDAHEAPTLIHDPALRLLLPDGASLAPASTTDGRFTFHLPTTVSQVSIVSRASRPCDVIGPFIDDRRFLGVLVGEITLEVGDHSHSITTHLTKEGEGWDVQETVPMRWTQGEATLDLPFYEAGEDVVLTLQLHAAGPYLEDMDIDLRRCA